MAILFADVVKYSQLTEEQIPQYVKYFLGAVAELEAKLNDSQLVKNTWGDALYYVFPEVEEAGKFALDLCDIIQNTNWSEKGLPKNLNLRISLHAGPVNKYINPITHNIGYIGNHVNYAARIEPITPPGKVYSSQAFAALACSMGIKSFTCDYVGQIPFAKGYGTFPTYHVRRCG
jgi:class 3 adenylate cyclase